MAWDGDFERRLLQAVALASDLTARQLAGMAARLFLALPCVQFRLRACGEGRRASASTV